LLLSVLLVVAACSGADNVETTGPTSATVTSTTPTTTDPASSLVGEPAAVAGIWLAEFGGVVLQFRIDQGPNQVLTGVLDSPMEGVTDLPATITADGTNVAIEIPVAAIVFEATVATDSLSGVWKQGGAEVPIVFTRQAEPFALVRTQEPQPPFPYESIPVRFDNGPITLGGSLVIPEGAEPFPAAVLISGSGQQDRDESIMGHKPFLVLADWLARRGIVTLRYDDRGVGESGGSPIGATSADFAEDALAAVALLADDERFSAIGLIGHSEGGLIAPMVAAQADVDFLVLLAGPGLPGAEVLARQTGDLMRAGGAARSAVDWRVAWSTEVIALAASDMESADVAARIREVLEAAAADVPPGLEHMVDDAAIEQTVAAFTDPWMRHFLAYKPQPALEALAVPVLALIGSLDQQVSSQLNIPALEAALAGNPDATVTELDGLNHLFQTATTGAVSEYGQIEETFDPQAMELVSDWILERFR
jgi:alpha-beta hydrolase superfamily lysophospholipase